MWRHTGFSSVDDQGQSENIPSSPISRVKCRTAALSIPVRRNRFPHRPVICCSQHISATAFIGSSGTKILSGKTDFTMVYKPNGFWALPNLYDISTRSSYQILGCGCLGGLKGPIDDSTPSKLAAERELCVPIIPSDLLLEQNWRLRQSQRPGSSTFWMFGSQRQHAPRELNNQCTHHCFRTLFRSHLSNGKTTVDGSLAVVLDSCLRYSYRDDAFDSRFGSVKPTVARNDRVGRGPIDYLSSVF